MSIRAWLRNKVGKHSHGTSSRRTQRLHCRPCLEVLESRLARATVPTGQEDRKSAAQYTSEERRERMERQWAYGGHGMAYVFADIGVPNPEEALAKAEIARQVNRILAERGLNQAQAGALLRIAQPRVSDLARGRLGKFSLEKLLQFARLTGIDVEIRMKPSSKPGLTVKSKAA